MQLNLARKWRSQTFDTIIGQQLPVRMLKNSLYVQHFFPVYLFAGVRGCGKTSTARIFAAAINCQALEHFIQNPKEQSIPCLLCTSCNAMKEGKHPDFIEIDAASHTGVDNVRAIIEAASLLPLLGRKKIYLIDEAHMLSKAAFNALLKILEEPPPSALFMLATTETYKILETVRSRCFQLFFTPVPKPELVEYLIKICKQESILYEPAGIEYIAKSSEGSVRDALNLIERVRFAASKITVQAVLSVLGHVDDQEILVFLEHLIFADQQAVVGYLDRIKTGSFSYTVLWTKLVELVRALIWIKHGVTSQSNTLYTEQLTVIADRCSLQTLIAFLDTLYNYEQLFLKTTVPDTLLELVVFKLARIAEEKGENSNLPTTKKVALSTTGVPLPVEKKPEASKNDSRWGQFIATVDNLKDPLLSSIFKQARFNQVDATGTVEITFAQQLQFFSDWLTTTQNLWQPLLQAQFGDNSQLKYKFIDDTIKPIEIFQKPEIIRTASTAVQPRPVKQELPLSADLKKGKQAQLLLKLFPGSISLIKDISL